MSLRVRNFRLYFIGQFISISGTWMQSIAQALLVLTVLHGTAVDLGITIALPFLPMLLLGPFGGLLADRSDKRAVLYATQSVAGVLALTLGLLVSMHEVSLLAVWILALLLGVVNLFDNPARQSFVQEMVGRELLPNAVSLNSALMNMGRVVGPAIGAPLIVVFGFATCFYVNAASYVGVIAALALMRSSEITRIRTVNRDKGQVRDGLRYAWNQPRIREVIASVAVVGTLAFNFTVTLPLLVTRVLHGGPTEYAYAMMSMGFGAVLGGLYAAHRSRPTVQLLSVLGIAFGVLIAAVAASPSVLVCCLALVPMGAMSIAFVSTANATLQLLTEEQMRGRVMSLYAMAFLGSTPVGALLMGWIADASNARVALGVGAFATFATGLWLWVEVHDRKVATSSLATGSVA
jgi:MFS family permease